MSEIETAGQARPYKKRNRPELDDEQKMYVVIVVVILVGLVLAPMFYFQSIVNTPPPPRMLPVSITLVDGVDNSTVSPELFYMKFQAYDASKLSDSPIYNKGEGWGKFWSNHTFTWHSYLEGLTLCVLLNDTLGRYSLSFHDLNEGVNVLTIYPHGWKE